MANSIQMGEVKSMGWWFLIFVGFMIMYGKVSPIINQYAGNSIFLVGIGIIAAALYFLNIKKM